MKIFKFSEDVELTPTMYEFWYKVLINCKENKEFYLLPPFIDLLDDDNNDEIEENLT